MLVGFLRTVCNGQCTARRFHAAENDHTCRVGCPGEPDSLITTSVPGFLHLSYFLRNATILPQRNHLFHDLISHFFSQSLQYGIVVMGFLDAFVYVHHKHRLDSANAGKFGDCLTGRVRFMTSITPAFAHAYQTICFAMHLLGVPHRSFTLPKPKSRYPHLPDDRSITRDFGNDYHGWAICTDGGTHGVDGEVLAGWGMISRSLRGSIFVLFGPVIISEAHLAFYGARTHSNNTAEMTAMIEALSFLGPRGPVTPDEQSFTKILCMLLVFVWELFKPAHMCSWRSRVNYL